MDEKKQEPEKKPKEEPATDTGEGSKYETTPIIERAREEREKLEAANKKKEELLAKEEELMAKKALGGESDTGQESEKPKELTPEETAEAFRDGKLENPFKTD